MAWPACWPPASGRASDLEADQAASSLHRCWGSAHTQAAPPSINSRLWPTEEKHGKEISGLIEAQFRHIENIPSWASSGILVIKLEKVMFSWTDFKWVFHTWHGCNLASAKHYLIAEGYNWERSTFSSSDLFTNKMYQNREKFLISNLWRHLVCCIGQ